MNSEEILNQLGLSDIDEADPVMRIIREAIETADEPFTAINSIEYTISELKDAIRILETLNK